MPLLSSNPRDFQVSTAPSFLDRAAISSSVIATIAAAASFTRSPTDPRLFLIGGESGIGKIHLLNELSAAATSQQLSTVRVDCTKHHLGIPDDLANIAAISPIVPLATLARPPYPGHDNSRLAAIESI